jgi:hypothetical protein
MFSSTPLPLILLFLIYASPTKAKKDQLIISSLTGQCISPAGGFREVSKEHIRDGTALTTIDCKEAAAWDISYGSGRISLTETSYVMDAGTPAGNNGQLKVRLDGQVFRGSANRDRFGLHTPVQHRKSGISPTMVVSLSWEAINVSMSVIMVGPNTHGSFDS